MIFILFLIVCKLGSGYSLQLSSGSHTVGGVFGITRENFLINGASAPLFAPTSIVNGPITFSVSVNNTRIKMKDIIISGSGTTKCRILGHCKFSFCVYCWISFFFLVLIVRSVIILMGFIHHQLRTLFSQNIILLVYLVPINSHLETVLDLIV